MYGELHRYIPVVAEQAGFRAAEVKVNHRRRTTGRSKYGWQRFMRGYLDLLTVLFLGRYQHRPQHLFGGLGTLLMFIGVLVELYLTIDKLVFGHSIGQRPLLLLGALLIIVGVQLLSLGLIGELIANSRARSGPDSGAGGARRGGPGRRGRGAGRGHRRAGARRRPLVTPSVAYFGTYDPGYPRNAVLLEGLRGHGVPVREFRAPLPALGAAQMATAAGAARLAAGLAAAHVRLLLQHPRELDADTVIVGYPGHFLVPFGRLLAAYRHARLVFDPLVSLWDTFAGDRGLVEAGGVKAGAVRAVDAWPSACRTWCWRTRGPTPPTTRRTSACRAGGWRWCLWAPCPSRAPAARPASWGSASRSPCSSTASGARCTARTWCWRRRSGCATSPCASCWPARASSPPSSRRPSRRAACTT